MTRIAVLDDYVGMAETSADWAGLGPDVEVTFYRDAIDPERLVDELIGYDVLAITQQRTWLTREVLAALPNLKLIVCNGSTSHAVDHDARRELGIMLCGTGPLRSMTGEGNPGPTEIAFALMLAVAKRIVIEDRAIREGGWQQGFPVSLAGKTLGIAGLGRLGSAMVPRAKAFEMDIIAWSQNLTDERTDELGVRRVSKEELLRECDVLAIFLKLSERTTGLFGREDLALMKPTAFLVNVSRGPIVDEDALIDALRSGQIAGAGLDVFDREPLAADNPLRTLENVVHTPHLGYTSEEGFRRAFALMVENITAYLKGEPTRVVE